MKKRVEKNGNVQRKRGKLIARMIISILAVFLLGCPSLYAVQTQHRLKPLKTTYSQLVPDKNMTSSKQREITLNADNAPLLSVLKRLANKARVGISYQDDMIPDKKVTVHVKDVSVYQALHDILKGTRLKAVLPFSRDVLVIKKRELKADVQQETVTGTVTDAQTGDPLIGVNILVVGTSTGTATDADGYYSLSVPSLQDTLRFSYIGYKTKTVAINGRAMINVQMKPTIVSGQQLVVVGFGSKKVKNLTGAVSHIGSKEITAVPVYNVASALQGRVSGVRVIKNSAAPGGRVQVIIRGSNSMIGDNSPLYVVNGLPIVGGINYLNPSDIKSVDVLKDAAATAIYGSRGSNGVIQITTKSGKKRQSEKLTINTYYGLQRIAKRYDVLNAKQYAIVANTLLENSGKKPYFDISKIQNPGTDWQDIIFQPAPTQNYTLTFSGGSEKTNYSVSGNYFAKKGIVMNSGVKRGSVRLSLDHNIKSWLDLSVNLNLSRRSNHSVPVNNGRRGNNVYSGALSAPPTVPVINEEGNPTRIQNVYPFGSIDMRNPLLWSKPYKNKNITNSVRINNSLNFNITKNLSFKTRIGVQYQVYNHHGYRPIIYSNDRGSASTSFSKRNNILSANTLTYKKSLNNEQTLEILGGFTYQTNTTRGFGVSVSGFPNNITKNFDLGSAKIFNPPSSHISNWKLMSWYGRINYSFQNRYYVTINFRADGSSRFGENNKWGIFPSGAFAWRISEEPFMQKVHFISNLKLRTSYGITGNTAISPYQSIARFFSLRYITKGHTQSIGYAPASISNPDLRWESTKEFDIGLNLSVLNNRVGFTFDYYKKKTSNLLASVPLPPSVGFTSILKNVGKIQNKGMEFSINSDIISNKNILWNVSANLSTNHNKVLKLAGQEIISSGIASGLHGYNIVREGDPLGMFYGYIEDGYDKNGFIKYVDVNGDGKIAPEDRVILGSPYPDFTFGFSSSLSYKNFNLSAFLQGTYGNKLFWRTIYTNLNSFQRGQNQLERFFGNYWTPTNTHAKYPKISNHTLLRPSNRFIKDASYMRLKSLKLSYNIPFSKLGSSSVLDKATVYLKAINLFTITDFPGLNPSVNTRGSDSGNIKRRIQIGTAQSSYPLARIFGAGINLSF